MHITFEYITYVHSAMKLEKNKSKKIITICVAALVVLMGLVIIMNSKDTHTTSIEAPFATTSANNTSSHNVLYLGEVTSQVLSSLNYYGSLSNYYFSSMLYVPFASYTFPPHPYLMMQLGEGYTHNANYTVYDLSLKSNLKWDNGQPITSKDLWLTLIISWQDGLLVSFNVTSVSIVNATTVQVTTSSPEPNLVQLWVTDSNSYVIPYSNYIVQDPNANITNYSSGSQFYNITKLLAFTNFKDIVADGPFVITNYSSTGENPLIFNANPYYWQGKPYMSQVVVRIFTSVASESAAMRSGEISGIWDMGSYNAIVKPNLEGIPNANLYKLEPGPYMSVDFDMFKWPFNTTQFRMALAYLTNRTAVNSIVNTPTGQLVGYNYLTPALDTSVGISPSSVNNYTLNTSKANALLAQVGIVYNTSTSEYMYNNSALPDYGQQVSFNIYTTQLGFGDLSTSIELMNQWRADGFNVNVVTAAVSPFYSTIYNLNTWDVAVQIDPLGYYPGALENVAGATGYDNSTYFNHPASFGMANFNYTTISTLSSEAYKYPIDSNQSNYYVRELANYLTTVVPQIPLWVNYNWELVSNNYYWGNQTNSTGIFNGQALVQEQFWYGTLYRIHYIGSSTSASPMLDYIIGGVVAAIVVIGVATYAVSAGRKKRMEKQ